MGLVLASMIVSCSDEDNNIVPDINPDPVPPTEGTFILPAPAVESIRSVRTDFGTGRI